MKKATGLVLLGVCSVLVTGGLLHGCGSKEEAPPGASGMPAGTGGTTVPAAPKFTIVGAGK